MNKQPYPPPINTTWVIDRLDIEGLRGPSRGRRIPRRSTRRRGMTLVEVLIASLLLGTGVAGLILSASLAMRNQQRSEQRMAAALLGNALLSEIEAAGPHTWSLTRPSRGTEMQGNVSYDWSARIEQLAVGELFNIQIQVNWQAAGQVGGNVEMEILLNDYAAVTANTLEERERVSGVDTGQQMERR